MPPSAATYDKIWNNKYKRLISYKQKYGNCEVLTRHKEDTTLAHWVRSQRKKYKNNKLSNDRIDKLRTIGFVFNFRKEKSKKIWDDMFNRLVSYKLKHGDCLVPKSYKEDKQLGSWVDKQRSCYKNNKVPNDQIDRLNSVGFVFSVRKDYNPTRFWNDMYDRLLKYRDAHGDCLVPIQYEEDTKLGHWVSNQRARYKYKKLSSDRIDKLNSIGFVFGSIACWQDQNDRWDDMLKRLVSYKQKHGNFKVPRCYTDNDEMHLGNWVHNQKMLYKNKKLSHDRLLKLKSIGFDFPDRWNDMFHRLRSYKIKNCNCLVPNKYKDNDDKNLGSWVRYQRQNYKNNKLSHDRLLKLKSIGFDFPDTWNDMFHRLRSYKIKNGNCLVPLKYKDDDDKNLGSWVKYQRQKYKNNKLSKDYLLKLKSIGFVFELRNVSDGNTENNHSAKINDVKPSPPGQIYDNQLVEHQKAEKIETRTSTTTPIRYSRRLCRNLVDYNEHTTENDEHYYGEIKQEDSIHIITSISNNNDCKSDSFPLLATNDKHNKDEFKAVEKNIVMSDNAMPVLPITKMTTETTTTVTNTCMTKTSGGDDERTEEDEEMMMGENNYSYDEASNDESKAKNEKNNTTSDSKLVLPTATLVTSETITNNADISTRNLLERKFNIIDDRKEEEENVKEVIITENKYYELNEKKNTTTYMLSDHPPMSVLLPTTKITTTETTTTIAITDEKQNIIINDEKKEKEDKEIININNKYFCDKSARRDLPTIGRNAIFNSSSCSDEDDNSSLFADAEEEDFYTITTCNSSSNWQLSAVSNTNTAAATCNDDDSIFADAEEDEDGSLGLL